jgi:hypothetical protein
MKRNSPNHLRNLNPSASALSINPGATPHMYKTMSVPFLTMNQSHHKTQPAFIVRKGQEIPTFPKTIDF